MNIFTKILSACLLCLAIGAAVAEVVDINSADAGSLAATISGIGPTRAEAIVAFRKDNGPFTSVDDLVLVRGIGPATVAKNRDKLTAGKP